MSVEREAAFEAIDTMLDAAAVYGLETEVVWSMARALQGDPEPTIPEACAEALLEWDL